MRFQVGINSRSKIEQRPADGSAHQRSLRIAPGGQAIPSSRGWGGVLPCFILNPLSLTGVHHRHKTAKAVQAARETAVGVKLYQHFFDFIHGQTGIEAFVKCRRESGHIPAGGQGRNRDNRLLAGIQWVLHRGISEGSPEAPV